MDFNNFKKELEDKTISMEVMTKLDQLENVKVIYNNRNWFTAYLVSETDQSNNLDSFNFYVIK